LNLKARMGEKSFNELVLMEQQVIAQTQINETLKKIGQTLVRIGIALEDE